MAIVEVDVSKRANTLLIGVQGEIDAQVFNFDISSWIEEYGSGGSASIDLQRPGESTSYTVGLTITDGIAQWVVSNVDNAIAGQGLAQLVYQTTKKTKTAEYVTVIERALDEQLGPTPDPYASYLDRARELYGQMQQTESQAAEDRAAAHRSGEAAAASAEQAEAAADRAEATFSVAGDVVFAINPDTSVTATFTEV